MSNTEVTGTWWAVYLHSSPEPNRVFRKEREAQSWGKDRDPDCKILPCKVTATRITNQ